MAHQQGFNQAATMPYGQMAAQNMAHQHAYLQQANHPYGNIATTTGVVTILLPSGFHFGTFKQVLHFYLPLPANCPLQEVYEETYHRCGEAARSHYRAVYGNRGKPGKGQYHHVVSVYYQTPSYNWLQVNHVELRHPNGMPVSAPASTAIVNGVTVYGYAEPSGATASLGNGQVENAQHAAAAPAVVAPAPAVVAPAPAVVAPAPADVAPAPADVAPAPAVVPSGYAAPAAAVTGVSDEETKRLSRSATRSSSAPLGHSEASSPETGSRTSSWPGRNPTDYKAPPPPKSKEKAMEPIRGLLEESDEMAGWPRHTGTEKAIEAGPALMESPMQPSEPGSPKGKGGAIESGPGSSGPPSEPLEPSPKGKERANEPSPEPLGPSLSPTPPLPLSPSQPPSSQAESHANGPEPASGVELPLQLPSWYDGATLDDATSDGNNSRNHRELAHWKDLYPNKVRPPRFSNRLLLLTHSCGSVSLCRGLFDESIWGKKVPV